MKYRKKPVIIDAIQFDGTNGEEVLAWMDDESLGRIEAEVESGEGPLSQVLIIKTLEGDMRATRGDFIIKGVRGEFYPCKFDIFTQTYEEVREDGTVEEVEQDGGVAGSGEA